MRKFELAFTCVDCGMADVPALHAMIESATDITFETFARRCNWRSVAETLGYAVGNAPGLLHINKDYHVRFKRSTWKGARCYFIVWSAIEHVFLEPSNA